MSLSVTMSYYLSSTMVVFSRGGVGLFAFACCSLGKGQWKISRRVPAVLHSLFNSYFPICIIHRPSRFCSLIHRCFLFSYSSKVFMSLLVTCLNIYVPPQFPRGCRTIHFNIVVRCAKVSVKCHAEFQRFFIRFSKARSHFKWRCRTVVLHR